TWYFKKLELVEETDRASAVNRLIQIITLYDKYKNYKEKDNQEKINELIVENMQYSNIKFKARLKEKKLFNEYIEKIPDFKLSFNSFEEFEGKNTSLDKYNALISINLLNEFELKNFEFINLSTMENKSFEIIIDEELFKKIDKNFWIKSFYIKFIRKNKSNIFIQMFRMNKLNTIIEKNNAKIIDKFISQKNKENDSLVLHS